MFHFHWMRGTKSKKYKVDIYSGIKKIKTVQFGDRRYEHYKDNTPLKLYSYLDHNDPNRRLNYKKRHLRILNKDGIPAPLVRFSPSWFSFLYLW